MIKIPVLILNLDADTERWTRMIAQFTSLPEFVIRRVPGVAGSMLPQLACDILTRTPDYQVGKGSLGVFLAHVAAWETAASLDAPYCLVLEDDVELLGLHRLAGFVLLADIDIAFCNDRLSLPVDQSAPLQISSMSAGLQALEESGTLAPGADGYILTPAGARALLQAVREDLCYGHVDWRILRYAVTAELADTVMAETQVGRVLRDHHHWQRPAWGVVRGGILSPCLVRHGLTPSRRERHDAIGQPASSGAVPRLVAFEGRTTLLYIADPDDHIQSFADRGEFYQSRQLACHRDLIPMDSTVIDVGANMGSHTLFYARYTWASRIYPIEPNLAARTLLLRSADANRHSGCRAEIRLDHVENAVGARACWGRMEAGPPHNLGSAVLQPTDASDPEAVRCVPLDELAFEGPIAFLKIDAGPMALDILAGAAHMIATHRPSIAIEIRQSQEPEFWQWLEDNNYQVVHAFADYIGCRDFVILSRCCAPSGLVQVADRTDATRDPGLTGRAREAKRSLEATKPTAEQSDAPDAPGGHDAVAAANAPAERPIGNDATYHACMNTGFAELESGSNEAAFMAFESAYRLNGTADSAAWCGVALRRLGLPTDACRYHRIALDRDPTNITAGFELASCLEDLQNFDAAIEAYRRLISDHDARHRAYLYNRLGICCERAERLDLLSGLLDEPDYYQHIDEDYAQESTILWLLKLKKPADDAALVNALRKSDASARKTAIIDALTIYIPSHMTPRDMHYQAYQDVLNGSPYGADAARILGEYSFEAIQGRLAPVEFMTVEQGVREICGHILESKPFSLVRLGDGEGNLLGCFMQPQSEFLWKQAEKIIYNWFGDHALPAPDYRDLDVALEAAVRDADLLGVPNIARITYEMTNDPRGYWGVYFAALYCVTHLRERRFITPVLHLELFKHVRFIDALRTVRALHTVSCHPEFGGKLRHCLDVPFGTDIIVPGEMGIGTLPAESRNGIHYPDVYTRTIAAINEFDAGAVVLIAAGVCGKVYANCARRAGCIAIDIGAMADFLMGHDTRAIFRSPQFLADHSYITSLVGT